MCICCGNVLKTRVKGYQLIHAKFSSVRIHIKFMLMANYHVKNWILYSNCILWNYQMLISSPRLDSLCLYLVIFLKGLSLAWNSTSLMLFVRQLLC